MKLIPRNHFDNLRLNDDHSYEYDKNGDTEIVKIYARERLIAKKKKQGKKTSYYGVKSYQKYLKE